MDELQTPYQVLHGALERAGHRGRPPAQARQASARRPERPVPDHRAADQRPRRRVRIRRSQQRVPLRLLGNPGGAAVPAPAAHAEALRAGAADGDRGRPERRRDLHRQVRAREAALPLGPLQQEEREELVLGARLASLGGQELRRDARAAHRPGSGGRLPRRRPRPAAHHRPHLQRRADAAVGFAGERDADRDPDALEQGRRLRQRERDPVRGQEGLRAALDPCREEPGHRGRERRDALGRARPEEDDRS